MIPWRPRNIPTAQSVARRMSAVYVAASSALEVFQSPTIYSRGEFKPIKTITVKEQYL